MTIEVESTAFREGEPIPNRYTCTDVNVSPELQWKNIPSGTKSIAVVCEDPDAPSGTWSHWVLSTCHRTAENFQNGSWNGRNLKMVPGRV
jgi:Raf kinase inhibitor-like YbhB/YbcL family protein